MGRHRDDDEWLAQRVRRNVLLEQGRDPESSEGKEFILYGLAINAPRPGKRRIHHHEVVNTEPASVYRAYDGEGKLLYVGITARGVRRAGQHSYRAKWWTEMVRQEWEHFATRQEALAREAHLIATEKPIHNVAGVRSSRTA